MKRLADALPNRVSFSLEYMLLEKIDLAFRKSSRQLYHLVYKTFLFFFFNSTPGVRQHCKCVDQNYSNQLHLFSFRSRAVAGKRKIIIRKMFLQTIPLTDVD